MTCLNEILAFHTFAQIKSLSAGQIALWYALMYINNKCHWQEWFTVASKTLESGCGLTREGIKRARNALKQLGLIDFKSSTGGKATAYKMIFLSDNTQGSTQDSTQGSTQGSTQDSTQDSTKGCTPLNRQDKNRQDKKRNTPSLSPSREENQEIDPLITLPLNDQSLYPVYPSDTEEWSELYPAVDVMQQLRSMRGWLEANPTKRKTQSGIRRFINGWLAREQDKGGNSYDSGSNSSHGVSGQTGENSGGITLRIPNVC